LTGQSKTEAIGRTLDERAPADARRMRPRARRTDSLLYVGGDFALTDITRA
jgi:hypothetical protein